MSRIVTTAGKAPATKPDSTRKAAIATIRAALRGKDSTDADVDEALEALVELAKSED